MKIRPVFTHFFILSALLVIFGRSRRQIRNMDFQRAKAESLSSKSEIRQERDISALPETVNADAVLLHAPQNPSRDHPMRKEHNHAYASPENKNIRNHIRKKFWFRDDS